MISLTEFFAPRLFLPLAQMRDGTLIRCADFFDHAHALSRQLPDQPYAINLCQDRYLFSVAYLAAFLRGQVTLLPANSLIKTITYLLKNYPGSYCLSDNLANAVAPVFLVEFDKLTRCETPLPLLNPHQPLSISFTSGSTGEPKALCKTWAEFATAAQLALQALDLERKNLFLLSTVPMQHMYGLETCFFWPLFSHLTLINARPFYPEDIRLTAQALPSSVLVSTPTHLKACVQTPHDWRNVHCVLSSTAPLPLELAQRVEQQFRAPLIEIYGSTETLSFAHRQPTRQPLWQPYQGMALREQGGRFFVQNGHLSQPVELDDAFEINDLGHFSALGRATDLIKIAGKRASLAELNRLLNEIPNVEDGLFFKTEQDRLAILLVGSARKNDIIAALRTAVDAVFLPKKIYRLPKIPRNALGKLIKSDIAQLIRDLTGG